jgi:hypothetical protein
MDAPRPAFPWCETTRELAMRQVAAVLGGMRLVLVLAMLLGGCATGPGLPLLSPLAAAGSFGYAEAAQGADRYSVSYVAPPRLTGSYPGPHEEDANAARTLAFDMSVWRAAQLAQAQGFTGFRVTDRRSDVSIYPDPYSYYYDPDPLFWEPGWPYLRRPYSGFGPFPPLPPRTYLQAKVTIDVLMLHALAPGDYDAASAIAQLRRTYPGAEGAPPPAG